MEILFAPSSLGESRSDTLGTSAKASESSSPSKLLGMRQDQGQELAPLHRAQAQPEAATAARSMPPHLRKRQPTSSIDTVWNTPADEHPTGAELELNGSKQINDFLGYSVEAETRTLQRSEVWSTPEYTPAEAKQNISAQKAIVESLLSKKIASSIQEHDRYLDSKLIGIMEEELDLAYRTTHCQLRDMSDKEFELHFQHTRKMHKIHWDKKINNRSDAANANITLANFQEQEQLLYGNRKTFLLD
ncbi:hypothetical protein G6514_008736 [Epicoccum nigrum]|nr:hypothetical protein G6514_008736 [Epicoccum nigrum]